MIENNSSQTYVDQLSSQLRKGVLTYAVLKLCAKQPRYTSDIIADLQTANLVVVEGTIYPLVSRLRKDGLLNYEWRESAQGPPRKYYKTTKLGDEISSAMAEKIKQLNTSIKKL